MASAEWINVTVAYATAQQQRVIPVRVPSASTLEQAIRSSGVLEQFSEINLSINPIGVFGELANLDDPVHEGERIEIYRALVADPKLARRRRAAAKSR